MLSHSVSILPFIGNRNIVDHIISNMQTHQSGGAMIFSGLYGIGKATMVHNIIRSYVIDSSISDAAILNNEHPDIRIIYTSDAPITTDIVHNMLQFLSMKPSLLPSKIIMLDNIDNMSSFTSNMMLNALESGISNTYFFLISHNIGSVIATIKSRCAILKIAKPERKNFITILEHAGAVGQDYEHYGFLSHWSPGLALLLINGGGLERYNTFIDNIGINNKALLSDDIASLDHQIAAFFIMRILFVLMNVASGCHNMLLPIEISFGTKYITEHYLLISDIITISDKILALLHQSKQYDLKPDYAFLCAIDILCRKNVQ